MGAAETAMHTATAITGTESIGTEIIGIETIAPKATVIAKWALLTTGMVPATTATTTGPIMDVMRPLLWEAPLPVQRSVQQRVVVKERRSVLSSGESRAQSLALP
jgi:hypothetical protein